MVRLGPLLDFLDVLIAIPRFLDLLVLIGIHIDLKRHIALFRCLCFRNFVAVAANGVALMLGQLFLLRLASRSSRRKDILVGLLSLLLHDVLLFVAPLMRGLLLVSKEFVIRHELLIETIQNVIPLHPPLLQLFFPFVQVS